MDTQTGLILSSRFFIFILLQQPISSTQECEILGCRIDYLATHDYAGDVEKVMNKLEDLYHRYGKKIWLTEFAVCCTRDEQDVINFVKVN